MEFTGPDGQARYDELVARADRLVIGLDFDGTLSPIVEQPEEAAILPGMPEVLVELAARVRAIAVITGRPARQALSLGDLDDVGAAVGDLGRDLYVLGQYGNERWTSHERRVITPKPPRGLSSFESRLPSILRRHDAASAYVEDKGLAVGIHTRRLPEPRAAFERLLTPVTEAAEQLGLVVEPGRLVIEVRAPGMDKGVAVRRLVEELDAQAFCFVGDDLGDVEAFRAVRELRDEQGLAGLLVCVDSGEESALRELADAVVSGPAGVLRLLRDLVEDVSGERVIAGA